MSPSRAVVFSFFSLFFFLINNLYENTIGTKITARLTKAKKNNSLLLMEDGEKIAVSRPVSPLNGQPVPVWTGGRPKGVPNKATTQFKVALNNLMEYAAPHMVDWLAEIKDPERRFDVLSKFAEYIYPKLARTENVGDGGGPVEHKLTVEFVDKNTGS